MSIPMLSIHLAISRQSRQFYSMIYELHVIAMIFSLYDIPTSREHMIVYVTHTQHSRLGPVCHKLL